MDRQQELIETFTNYFITGRRFTTIVEARAEAATILGQSIPSGSSLAKFVDESLERALVRAAQIIVRSGQDTFQTYERIVNLYSRQPTLGTRSSTSIAQQAYSTPVPIAYLATRMVGIGSNTTVYEPTAGNGSLLLATQPNKVIANELNTERAADLRLQGYVVTEQDATNFLPKQEVDVVIMNPPFGSVLALDGKAKVFELPGAGIYNRSFISTQIDHVIALNSLRAMKADGRAVLILGGKMGDERSRSNRYNSQLSRAFYYTLYNQYNVTRHISIDGNLYSRQGASFPIDMILIAGRGKSKLALPAVAVPPIYRSFDELKELLPHAPISKQQESLDASLDRTNERSIRSSPASTEPKPNTKLQQVSTVTGNAERMDDPARREPVHGVGDDKSLHQPGRDVLRSIGLASAERSPPEVGDRYHTGESLFSGEAELRHKNNLSSASSRERRSFEDNRADNVGGMAATDGSTTKRGLDVKAIPQQQETAKMPESVVPDEPLKATTQPQQVRYIPSSKAQAAETLVPANMQAGMTNALSRLQKQVGSLDEYVADRLNYGSPEQLHQYLNAEQVDAVALAISNLEKKRGFIIGDQTGVGKGRVVASVIRYARQTGRIPIFITKDPVLYADMMRDLSDIGMASLRAFPTNSDLSISLPNGQRLRTDSTNHKQEMQSLLISGGIGNYDAIFTTYSQMQSVKGQETLRRDFLRAMAPKSIIIMDESHEAGGSQKFNDCNAVPDRAKFVRELLSLSQGAVYSSATFAKRPDVMDLYALTDMGQAVSTQKLVGLVERGGIPMQQGLATMLVEAGQYIRRERSYEGVSFDAKISPVDKDVTENMSSIMAAILEFDRLKQDAVKGIDKDLKAEAKSHSLDNSIGAAGADSTNFTSIMHNLIEQSLLALKTEATVQACLISLKNNEKPVIALASTMGSFIGDYAKLNNLSPGDSINLSFGDLLKRYLERSRDILVKDYTGNKTRYRLTDEELGVEGVAQYEAVLDQLNETDLSGIPISPIDYIKYRLQHEGYRIEEVTGRTETINYGPAGNTTYSQRQASKTTDRNSIEAFNSGQIDVIILNRSGATGISLHASERFIDQRQRHMIVVQPEKDINNFMQMLGRIHRTGQVVLPKFTLLMADIPAEKRPNAVLLKKMASLNANTTAARRSGINLDSIPDFLNEYGSQVVVDLLGNNPELNYKLASPLGSEDEIDLEKLISKVTGRIPLLPLAEQEAFYQRLESDYQELIERQEAMGESILEATSLDLNARTIARMEVIPSDQSSNSPFTNAVYLEVVDAKTPRKPLTVLEVANVCRNSLGMAPITDVTDREFEKIRTQARAEVAIEVASVHRQTDEYRYQATKKLSQPATEKLGEKLDKQLSHVQGILQDFPVGERVRVVTSNQNIFYGVVGRVWNTSSDSGNPVVPANWRMQLLLADQARELTIPLSKINTIKENAVNIVPQERDIFSGEDVYRLFDLRQTQQRQERQVFTGNILRAYEAFNGKLINFTDNRGRIRQGILTPQGFDIEKTLESEPVRMPTVADAKLFITQVTQRTGSVKTFDQFLTIKAEKRGNGFVVQTPKTKDIGSQYYLDPDILAAAGADFYSIGDRMECVVPPERIDAVLEVITKEKRLSLAAFDQRSQAREMLGIDLPKLEQVELGQFESEGNYTPDVYQRNSQPTEAPQQQFVDDSTPCLAQPTLEPVQSKTNEVDRAELAEIPDDISISPQGQLSLPKSSQSEQVEAHQLSLFDSASNSSIWELKPLPTAGIIKDDPTPSLEVDIAPNLESQSTSNNQQEDLLSNQIPALNTEKAGDRLTNPMQIFQQFVDRVDKRTGDFLAAVQPSSPSIDTLRQWYRASRELGRSQQYLERIAEVANEFKQGQPLTDKAVTAMQQDLNTYNERIKVIRELDKLSDRDFLSLQQSVANYFNAAPPCPPANAQRQIAQSEISQLTAQIENLWKQHSDQINTVNTGSKSIWRTWNQKYKEGVAAAEKTLSQISQVLAQKEQKESQLQRWDKQTKAYQAWEKDPYTIEMKKLAKTIALPQIQERLTSIQQAIKCKSMTL